MTNLEVELHKLLVQLVVRYPDGWERIEAAVKSVYEAGLEMGLEKPNNEEIILH